MHAPKVAHSPQVSRQSQNFLLQTSVKNTANIDVALQSRDEVHVGNGDDVFHDARQGRYRGPETINGTGGDDLFSGGAGDDVIDGGSDNDRLEGGTGNDTLTGDSGADVFVFGADWGMDVVTDFEISTDVIRWETGSGIASLSDVSLILVDGGVEVTVAGALGSVLLEGMTSVEVGDYDLMIVGI